MALYASASPKQLTHDALTLATVPGVDIDRVHRSKPNGRPEGIAQDAIIEYLQSRPDIGGIVRFNSGALKGGSKKDRFFVRFNTIYHKRYCPELDEFVACAMADLQAIHRPTGRVIAIEVKAPGWKHPGPLREYQQAAYLEHVRECGGIAGFATSIEDVKRLLEGI